MYELDKPQSPQVQTAVEKLRSWINVARIISDTRMKLKLTQAEVARLAGTKQSRVSELETLSGNLRFKTLDSIASVLGLEITLQNRTVVPSITAVQTRDSRAYVKVGEDLTTNLRMVDAIPLFENRVIA